MKLGLVLLAAAAMVWLPAAPVLAQSDVEPQVAACLNSSALSGLRDADARVDTAKTEYPTAPAIRGQAYIPVTDALYAIPPDQLRYHARLESGEPLFALFGTALGAPGSLYMLIKTATEEDGCGFLRFNLRDRWMTTYSENGFWELIDRASVTYEAGTFEFEMIVLGGYRSPNADPAHAYDLDYMAFRCPNRRGLHVAVNMNEAGEPLWAGRFTGDDDQPDWQESMPDDRVLPLQHYFCGNGAGALHARHFPDKESALAAWRAEHGN